ncbi:MAG: hypothetical protein E7299_05395 [Lachnospiraceae bacterium]|nr:hypothetical protein [Lachnospiraceae bacterium]
MKIQLYNVYNENLGICLNILVPRNLGPAQWKPTFRIRKPPLIDLTTIHVRYIKERGMEKVTRGVFVADDV